MWVPFYPSTRTTLWSYPCVTPRHFLGTQWRRVHLTTTQRIPRRACPSLEGNAPWPPILYTTPRRTPVYQTHGHEGRRDHFFQWRHRTERLFPWQRGRLWRPSAPSPRRGAHLIPRERTTPQRSCLWTRLLWTRLLGNGCCGVFVRVRSVRGWVGVRAHFSTGLWFIRGWGTATFRQRLPLVFVCQFLRGTIWWVHGSSRVFAVSAGYLAGAGSFVSFWPGGQTFLLRFTRLFLVYGGVLWRDGRGALRC